MHMRDGKCEIRHSTRLGRTAGRDFLRRRAFTLVELLVTIGIIGLLFGILFPAIGAIKIGVNKARARAVIGQLCTACRAYHNDYGKWPSPKSFGDVVLILDGARNPVTGEESAEVLSQNPKKVKYMEFPLKLVTAPGPNGGRLALYDSWGTPYAYCFDNGVGGRYCLGPQTAREKEWTDPVAGDNLVPKPFSQSGSAKDAGKIDGNFAFFSNGPDTITGLEPSRKGSPALACEDDIRSWE